MAIRVAAALALVALLTAAESPSVPTRTCAERAESDSQNPVELRSADDIFVARRLLLVGAAGVKRVDYRRDGTYWLKSLAVLRSGRAVTLSVPRRHRRHLRLLYDGGERGEVSVRIVPCPTRIHEWTYYPGGFLYTKRGCHPIDIRFDRGRTVRRHVALGAGVRCAAT